MSQCRDLGAVQDRKRLITLSDSLWLETTWFLKVNDKRQAFDWRIVVILTKRAEDGKEQWVAGETQALGLSLNLH